MEFLTGYLPIMLGVAAILILISIFVKEKRIVPPMVVSSISLISIFISYFFEGKMPLLSAISVWLPLSVPSLF